MAYEEVSINKKGLTEDARVNRVGINVRISPRAKRNEISSIMDDGSVKIRLTAPPVEGKANQALIKYLAEILKISTTDIEIVAGHSGRQKVVLITGFEEENLRKCLFNEISLSNRT